MFEDVEINPLFLDEARPFSAFISFRMQFIFSCGNTVENLQFHLQVSITQSENIQHILYNT